MALNFKKITDWLLTIVLAVLLSWLFAPMWQRPLDPE